jgi:hypothetical protein
LRKTTFPVVRNDGNGTGSLEVLLPTEPAVETLGQVVELQLAVEE